MKRKFAAHLFSIGLYMCLLTILVVQLTSAQEVKKVETKANMTFPIKQTNPDKITLTIEKVEKAQVQKHDAYGGNYFAVFVSLVADSINSQLMFNQDNTKLVLSDGSEISEWIAWFPDRSSKKEGVEIKVSEGEMISIQIALSNKVIDDAYGRGGMVALGYGSILRVGGEMDLSYNMAYYNSEKGKLLITFPKNNDSNSMIFLFPAKGKEINNVNTVHFANFGETKVKRSSGAQGT